ncbi:MAG: site-2 protease family protein [Anaerolineales bacterium]|nr:site-2 protease family protein [Anaerolineales bacterium]
MLNLDPATLISRIIILITAFSVHEFAHAWTADQFGDQTPRMNGRLTLNPAAHLDPMGSLMLIVAGFGWAKPVPVNPYALKRSSPAGPMWVSLAGPLSNFLMAVLAAVPFRVGLVSLNAAISASYNGSRIFPTLPGFLWEFISINLVLMLFNLIPLAPLDGEKVAMYFVPPSWKQTLEEIRPYGPMILLALFIIGPYLGLDILGWILGPPLRFLVRLLIG